jgi:hypothetical protein
MARIPSALALGIAQTEVLLLGPRAGHHVEGGVRDVVADLAADHDLGAAPDLDIVDGPLGAVGEELGQRVTVLVQVVVGVEHRDVERSLCHESSSGKCETFLGWESTVTRDQSPSTPCLLSTIGVDGTGGYLQRVRILFLMASNLCHARHMPSMIHQRGTWRPHRPGPVTSLDSTAHYRLDVDPGGDL